MRDHRNIRNESRMLPSFCENLQGLSDDAAAKKHFPIKMKHFPINTRNKNEKDNIFQCFRYFQSFRYSRSFRAFEWQSWESRFGNAAKKIIVSLPSSLSSKLHENICIFRCFVFFFCMFVALGFLLLTVVPPRDSLSSSREFLQSFQF